MHDKRYLRPSCALSALEKLLAGIRKAEPYLVDSIYGEEHLISLGDEAEEEYELALSYLAIAVLHLAKSDRVYTKYRYGDDD